MAARQKCRCAVQIDGEAAFDTAENNPFDALIGFKVFLQLDPTFLAACLIARQNSFAHSILNTVDKNLDLIAHANLGRLAGHGKFTQRHTAFGFQADIDNRQIIFNGGDAAAHNRALNRRIGGKAFFQKRGEIISARVHTHFSILVRHFCVSLIMPNPALFVRLTGRTSHISTRAKRGTSAGNGFEICSPHSRDAGFWISG